MKHIFLFIFVLFLNLSLQAQALGKAKLIDGQVSLNGNSLFSIDEIKSVEEKIGTDSAIDSYIVLEITGTYKGSRGSNDDVVSFFFERLDDRNPMTYFRYQGRLVTSIMNQKELDLAGNNITPAIHSGAIPFKTKLKLSLNYWASNVSDRARWVLTFDHPEEKPFRHTVTKSVYVNLIYNDKVKEWSVTPLTSIPK